MYTKSRTPSSPSPRTCVSPPREKKERREGTATAPSPPRTPWLALVPGHPLLMGLARARCKPATIEEEHRQEEQQIPQFLYDDTSDSARAEYAMKNPPPTTCQAWCHPMTRTIMSAGPCRRIWGISQFPWPYHPNYLYQHLGLSSGPGLQRVQMCNGSENSEYGVEEEGEQAQMAIFDVPG